MLICHLPAAFCALFFAMLFFLCAIITLLYADALLRFAACCLLPATLLSMPPLLRHDDDLPLLRCCHYAAIRRYFRCRQRDIAITLILPCCCHYDARDISPDAQVRMRAAHAGHAPAQNAFVYARCAHALIARPIDARDSAAIRA